MRGGKGLAFIYLIISTQSSLYTQPPYYVLCNLLTLTWNILKFSAAYAYFAEYLVCASCLYLCYHHPDNGNFIEYSSVLAEFIRTDAIVLWIVINIIMCSPVSHCYRPDNYLKVVYRA